MGDTTQQCLVYNGDMYTLHLGDCLEFMQGLVPMSVDAIITDPPYGIGENNKRALSRANMAAAIDYGEFDWDNKPITQEHLSEMLRVSHAQVIFGGNYYANFLPASSSWIVWDKLNGTNDFADCEMAWTSHKRAARMFRYLWAGMIKARPEIRYHPTQKPLALMNWCIANYTSPNDTILDPFMGSGTTGVACMKLGRNFIGCEINEGYFMVAERRIEEAASQMLLPMDM